MENLFSYTPVAEETASAKQGVWTTPSHSFEPFQQCTVNALRPKVLDELVVVNGYLFSIHVTAFYIPRCNFLLVGASFEIDAFSISGANDSIL